MNTATTATPCTLCQKPEDPTGNTPPMILLAGKYPVCTICYDAVARSMKAVHIDAVEGSRLAAAVLDNYSLPTGVDIESEADRQKLAEAVARTVKAIAVAIGRPE
ncbi:MAG: hypothetical protein WC700_17105 [Gemmatimonadaceae bacterium]